MLCIEATMKATTFEATASASVIEASVSGVGGIKATMHALSPVTATMRQVVAFESTMTANVFDAYISYSCPIAYIESCMSLGGWDDELGWNNSVGWKN